jgi:hypothetical protein
MKKLLISLTAIVLSIACFAEQTASVEKNFRQDPFNHPLFPVFLVTLFAGVVLILLVAVGIYSIRTTRFLKTKMNNHSVMRDQSKLVAPSIRVNRKWSLYHSLGVIAVIVVVLTLTGFILI